MQKALVRSSRGVLFIYPIFQSVHAYRNLYDTPTDTYSENFKLMMITFFAQELVTDLN